MARADWNERETMAAFALYWVLPPKDYRPSCPDIVTLAEATGRTPNAIKMKLENLKRGDPNRLALGQTGLPNGARLELTMWDEYHSSGNAFLESCLEALHELTPAGEKGLAVRCETVEMPPLGEDRPATRTERVNQSYFRNSLLTNYEERCCLTGISEPRLLVASHIKPWAVSDPATERLAPSNGILLNALHDKAFDKGLITLNRNLEVVVSPKLRRDEGTAAWVAKLEGQRIREPIAMPPARQFIEYHNDVIFVA